MNNRKNTKDETANRATEHKNPRTATQIYVTNRQTKQRRLLYHATT